MLWAWWGRFGTLERELLGPKLMFAERDKHYPSRSGQTNITKPVTKIYFWPSIAGFQQSEAGRHCYPGWPWIQTCHDIQPSKCGQNKLTLWRDDRRGIHPNVTKNEFSIQTYLELRKHQRARKYPIFPWAKELLSMEIRLVRCCVNVSGKLRQVW